MILTAVLVFLAVLLTDGRGLPTSLLRGDPGAVASGPAPDDDARGRVVAQMLRRPEVHGASFDGDWLDLAVTDVDADWNGYAAEVCDFLARTGSGEVPGVRMVDAAYLRAGRGYRELGMAYCS